MYRIHLLRPFPEWSPLLPTVRPPRAVPRRQHLHSRVKRHMYRIRLLHPFQGWSPLLPMLRTPRATPRHSRMMRLLHPLQQKIPLPLPVNGPEPPTLQIHEVNLHRNHRPGSSKYPLKR